MSYKSVAVLFQFLKKLHLQERVVDEVKQAIRPFYSHKKITKDEYKEILRKAVPKVMWWHWQLLVSCHLDAPLMFSSMVSGVHHSPALYFVAIVWETLSPAEEVTLI